jgi:hypothetical protein
MMDRLPPAATDRTISAGGFHHFTWEHIQVTTHDEFDRRIERLNAALIAMRDLMWRMQEDEETTAYEDEGLNAQAIKTMREMAAATRDVRAVLGKMSDEERERIVSIIGKSRDPELLKRFFGI